MASHVPLTYFKNEKWYKKIVCKAIFLTKNVIVDCKKNTDVIKLTRRITLLTDDYKCKPDIDRVFSFTTKSDDKIIEEEDIVGQTINNAIFEVHLKNDEVDTIFLVM
jgi:hypothetical protein